MRFQREIERKWEKPRKEVPVTKSDFITDFKSSIRGSEHKTVQKRL